VTATVRLAIIDAHPMFRVGIAHFLAAYDGYEVVAEGAGIGEAVRLARDCAPDIMVLDLHSELCSDSLRRISAECPTMRILVLTVLAEEDGVMAALRAGAAGYVLKGASGSELVESINRVHRGELYVYPPLAAQLLRGAGVQPTPNIFAALTVREGQVLDHLTRGLSNKEIGRQLCVSEKTIKHYMTTLFEKLQVHSRLEAAMLVKVR
jgi:two-component system, NarL family, nitrate/nitrite response regulator NarL